MIFAVEVGLALSADELLELGGRTELVDVVGDQPAALGRVQELFRSRLGGVDDALRLVVELAEVGLVHVRHFGPGGVAGQRLVNQALGFGV